MTTTSSSSLNVDQYLNIQSYSVHGHELKLGDGTQVYATGKSQCKNGVIIIPDMLGWNTGRIRNLCDFFGDHDCFSVIPNFSSKGVEGHTQSFMESSSVMDWYKSRTFDGNIKPVICSVVNFMKKEGVEKINLLGFAWGSWAVVNLLASDCAEEFQCGALSSPSVDLEEKMYGGSVPELMSRVNRPILVMPTRGDPEYHKAYLKLLKYKLPTSKIIDYHDIEDHFMLRGNSDNEHIRHAIQKSVNEINGFFHQHFEMNPQDLVRETEDIGPEGQPKSSRTWTGYMKETREQMGEGMEKARERMTETGEKLREGTRNLGESIGQRTEETGQKIGEQTKQTGEKVGEQTKQGGEHMKQKAHEDKAKEDKAKEDQAKQEKQGKHEHGKQDKPLV